MQFDEPGVLMTFEENAEELAEDVASLGFDLPALVDRGRLVVDYVHVERSEIEETGEYDLEGLFVRLDHAVQSIGAKRVVLDTIESLFGGLQNEAILRAELRRLFRWLRDRDLTVVITGERGETTLTRHGLEEYVTDAVIQLDHRVHEQISTRRIRVVKYRGSHHGTNEYPFLIDADGISVLPVTSLTLQHDGVDPSACPAVSPQLDEMLGGQGYFRGSTVLVSGNGRHRQDHAGGAFRRRRVPARRAMPVLPVRGVARADDPQHAVGRHRSCSRGSTAGSCSSTPIGRRGSAWRRISCSCTAPSSSFSPTSSSSIR